jgi:hypothetical protein
MNNVIGLLPHSTARAWIEDIKVGRKTKYAEVPHKTLPVERGQDSYIHSLLLEPVCDFLGCVDLTLPLHGRTIDDAVLWISMHVDDEVFDVWDGPGLQALIDASCVLKGDPRRVVVRQDAKGGQCLIPIVTCPVGNDDIFACQLGTTLQLRVAIKPVPVPVNTGLGIGIGTWFSFTSPNIGVPGPVSASIPECDIRAYGTQHWLTEHGDEYTGFSHYFKSVHLTSYGSMPLIDGKGTMFVPQTDMQQIIMWCPHRFASITMQLDDIVCYSGGPLPLLNHALAKGWGDLPECVHAFDCQGCCAAGDGSVIAVDITLENGQKATERVRLACLGPETTMFMGVGDDVVAGSKRYRYT